MKKIKTTALKVPGGYLIAEEDRFGGVDEADLEQYLIDNNLELTNINQ